MYDLTFFILYMNIEIIFLMAVLFNSLNICILPNSYHDLSYVARWWGSRPWCGHEYLRRSLGELPSRSFHPCTLGTFWSVPRFSRGISEEQAIDCEFGVGSLLVGYHQHISLLIWRDNDDAFQFSHDIRARICWRANSDWSVENCDPCRYGECHWDHFSSSRREHYQD